MLGNLHDYDPSRHAVPYAELPELDRYMLGRLAEVMAEALTLTLTLTLTPTPTPTQTQTQTQTLTPTPTLTITTGGPRRRARRDEHLHLRAALLARPRLGRVHRRGSQYAAGGAHRAPLPVQHRRGPGEPLGMLHTFSTQNPRRCSGVRLTAHYLLWHYLPTMALLTRRCSRARPRSSSWRRLSSASSSLMMPTSDYTRSRCEVVHSK